MGLSDVAAVTVEGVGKTTSVAGLDGALGVGGSRGGIDTDVDLLLSGVGGGHAMDCCALLPSSAGHSFSERLADLCCFSPSS